MSTPHGKLALPMFAALAEYERALLQERVMAGIAAARARGQKGGCKPKLSPEQQPLAADMARGRMPITRIATTLRCSRHTVYKALGPTQVAHEEAPMRSPSRSSFPLPSMAPRRGPHPSTTR